MSYDLLIRNGTVIDGSKQIVAWAKANPAKAAAA